MDPSGRTDPAHTCSFCQGSFPTISHLFRAADGPSICDGCVEMLAADLRANHGRNTARSPARIAHETMALSIVEWGSVIDELRRLGYPWLADRLRRDLDGHGSPAHSVVIAMDLQTREARVIRSVALAMATVVAASGSAAEAEADWLIRHHRNGH
jgi:hypothetical protein